MKDAAGHVLYVGKAKNLKNRVRSYFQAGADHSPKTVVLVSHIRDIELMHTVTEAEALLLENNLIKKWKPRYNIRLKDDKTYPYLRLDLRHPFPRPYIARKQLAGDGSEYFGPFPHGAAAYTAMEVAAKVFLIRDCRDYEFSNRSRPCLSYQIGQCTAPCVGYVSQEQYKIQIEGFRKFLNSGSEALERQWEAEMLAASEALDFEKAATLRDRLAHIRSVGLQQDQSTVDTKDLGDRDIWAFAKSEDGQWLDSLVLQFRGGKWMGQIHTEADLNERLETEDFTASLMLQFYAKHPLPGEILIPFENLPNREGLPEILAEVAAKASRAFERRKARIKDRVPMPAEGSGAEGEGRDEGSPTEAHFEQADKQCEASGPRVPVLRDPSEKGDWERVWALAQENVRQAHEHRTRRRQASDDGLVAIARLLDLEKPPRRIECVDISNFQGEANVASAVVFTGGKPDKAEYRHYKIQGFEGQDDFASMREVMSRRYGKPDSPKPDLLVIDGGKGQLASAKAVLDDLGCVFPVVGLAKARTKSDFTSSDVEASEERIFLPNQKNFLRIKNAQALRILTHIRDEAHRFAIEFHRKKRDDSRF
jgi:excinuclease ABC subunit C